MRSIDMLRDQHRTLEKLVSQTLTAKGPERIRLLGQLAEDLTLHIAVEEEHFYPALQQNGLGDAAGRALKEHERMRRLVAEILELKRTDPRLEGKVTELAVAAREHCTAEDRAVPAVEAAFANDQLEAMGEAMQGTADRLRGAELLKADEIDEVRA